MGKIKKILENELVGGTQTTDVYPVTSTKAVYDENNERLDNIINKIEPGIIYDVSANNDGAVFESLSALLSSSNLSTLIPTSVRHGGMTIRFIQGSEQSSDNKYVQYRLMSTSFFSINEANWQGVDEQPTAGSDNLVKSGGVNDKISELEKSLNEVRYIQGSNLYDSFSTGIIVTNGEVGSVVDLTIQEGNYRTLAIDVNQGDTYYIEAWGMTRGRLYCVLDSENRIIEGYQASANLNTINNPFTLIIPKNGKKVVFNCNVNTDNKFVKLTKIIDEIPKISKKAEQSLSNSEKAINDCSENKNRIDGTSVTYIKDVYPSQFTSGTIATNGSAGSVVNFDVVASEYYKHCVIDVNSEDSIVVKGLGMTQGRLYCVLDSENRIIEGYQASKNLNTIDNPFTLIIPENGKKVVFNITPRAGTSFLVTKKIYPDSIEELRNKVKVLEEEKEKDVIYRTILNNRLPQKKETDEVNILCIGNSFTQDLVGYVPNILQSLNITNVKIGTIIGGGHTIKMMYDKLLDNSTFDFTYTGGLSATKTILEALKYKDWDVVVINQARLDNGIWEDIEPYLANYVGLIKANSNYHVSIAYQITWAFSDKFSTEYSKIASVNYSSQTNKNYWAKFETQENQWKCIKSVGNKIISTGINIIIPTGQAIENLRTTNFVNENYQFTRDTLHLDYGVGRFTAACVFIQSIIAPILGKTIDNNTFIPSAESYTPVWDGTKYDKYSCVQVTEDNKTTIYNAVKLACSNIFSTYTL